MFTSIFRVIKFAFQDFFRNFWLSIVTLTILILALFTVNLLIIFNLVTNTAITSIEDKVDINVYFKADISEDQVQNVQKYLQSMAQVKEVDFVSKNQALESFKTKHQDNPKILQSLEEININPLGASLIIKAKKSADYPVILENLQTPQYNNLIESKDFDDHKIVIERITSITQKVSRGVILVAIIFALISILIIFNAIRMAIYTHRDEIMAMKLVGATDWFVEVPFLLQGIIFAFLSIIITIIIIYPLLGFIRPYLQLILENDFNIVNYFNQNFIFIFGLEFLVAMFLNLISSYIAVKRYVKV
ncbi:MAG: permease-like cell division protein FtsX [Candidatus Parcubacteria bacterium]|nr:permease-like cell division protein FtsX [Candidatus Parcubacteria bacterium]